MRLSTNDPGELCYDLTCDHRQDKAIPVLQILFAKDDDSVSTVDIPCLRLLAEFMKINLTLQVRVDGYAEGNSSDDYANLLSWERAMAVEKYLRQFGIDDARIKSRFHGNSFVMIKGENQKYRNRVDIHITECRC